MSKEIKKEYRFRQIVMISLRAVHTRSGLYFFLDGLDEYRGRFSSVDSSLYKLSKGLFSAKYLEICGVGLYLPEQFGLFRFAQSVVEEKIDFPDECLQGWIVHNRNFLAMKVKCV